MEKKIFRSDYLIVIYDNDTDQEMHSINTPTVSFATRGELKAYIKGLEASFTMMHYDVRTIVWRIDDNERKLVIF